MKPKVLICTRRSGYRRKLRQAKAKKQNTQADSQPSQSLQPELQCTLIQLVNRVGRLEKKLESNQARLEEKLDLLLNFLPQNNEERGEPESRKRHIEMESSNQEEDKLEEEEPLLKEKTPVKRLRWVDNTPPRRTYTFRQATAAQASTDCILKLLREEVSQNEKEKENLGNYPSINILESVAQREKLEESQGFAFMSKKKKATSGSSGASPLLIADIQLEPKTAAESQGPSEEDDIFKLLNRSAHASHGSSFINEQEINIAAQEEETLLEEALQEEALQEKILIEEGIQEEGRQGSYADEEEDDVMSLLTQESPLQQIKLQNCEFDSFEEIGESQQSVLNSFRSEFTTKRAQRYIEG